MQLIRKVYFTCNHYVCFLDTIPLFTSLLKNAYFCKAGLITRGRGYISGGGASGVSNWGLMVAQGKEQLFLYGRILRR